MVVTLTQGATAVVPELVEGYEWTSPFESLTHSIIGRNYPDVTYRWPGLRTGRLAIFCVDQAAAAAVERLHRQIGIFTLNDDDSPGANMLYVPVGGMTATLDPETRIRWRVNIGFQELPGPNTPIPPPLNPPA